MNEKLQFLLICFPFSRFVTWIGLISKIVTITCKKVNAYLCMKTTIHIQKTKTHLSFFKCSITKFITYTIAIDSHKDFFFCDGSISIESNNK